MQTLEVRLQDASYPVYLGHGILSDGAVWRHHLGQGKTLIVTNETVAPLYLEFLQSALGGHPTAVCILPDGEPFKTLESWAGVIDQLVSFGARRDATIIALGGGVIGDISGFAAASYMRGIRFLQIPTTLLAQVDASVGGKTGVNHQAGKNLIGAFYQPAAVIIDTATLVTLPEREYRAGLAEVVKYGAIMDPALFGWLWKNSEVIGIRQDDALEHMVQKSVLNKARIVGADERESGIRAILNFGHTFGHAIETVTGYSQFLHGEAVAIGMVMASHLSEMRGLCPPGTTLRLFELLLKLGLPVELPGNINSREITQAMGLDKKALASGSRLILLKQVGEAVIDSTSTEADILAAVDFSRPKSSHA